MYLTNLQEFTHTARFWTEIYAMPRADSAVEGTIVRERRKSYLFSRAPEAVQRMVEMGFSEESARKALADNNFDESAAVNALLTSV
jgi:uncharacterized UBP type Zn finger protein